MKENATDTQTSMKRIREFGCKILCMKIARKERLKSRSGEHEKKERVFGKNKTKSHIVSPAP